MANFYFEPLKLKGAYVFESFFSYDKRGENIKYYDKEIFDRCGIKIELSETFVSISKKNVIRGIHFQESHPQTKLVSVLQGKVYDVIVDLRTESTTFKQWIGVELSRENHKALYIPQGFGHGFAALEDETIMLYQLEGEYDKVSDMGIRFDDPDLGIDWPVASESIICSERDLRLMSLQEYVLTVKKTICILQDNPK